MNQFSCFPSLPPMFSYFGHLICGSVLLDPLSLLEGFPPLLFIFLEGNFLGSLPLSLPGPCDFLLDYIFLEFIYQFFLTVCYIILSMDIWFGGPSPIQSWDTGVEENSCVFVYCHVPFKVVIVFKTEMSFRFGQEFLFINPFFPSQKCTALHTIRSLLVALSTCRHRL